MKSLQEYIAEGLFDSKILKAIKSNIKGNKYEIKDDIDVDNTELTKFSKKEYKSLLDMLDNTRIQSNWDHGVRQGHTKMYCLISNKTPYALLIIKDINATGFDANLGDVVFLNSDLAKNKDLKTKVGDFVKEKTKNIDKFKLNNIS